MLVGDLDGLLCRKKDSPCFFNFGRNYILDLKNLPSKVVGFGFFFLKKKNMFMWKQLQFDEAEFSNQPPQLYFTG